jgi:CHAD domain-containing protein
MGETAELYDALRSRMDAFARDAEGVYGGDVDALHRTRVASRRLREVLPLLGLDGADVRKARRRLKKVTRQLGATRELDALALVIHELSQDVRYSATALKQVRAGVEEARAAASEQMASKLPHAKMQRLARRLERVARQVEREGERTDGRRPRDSRRAWLWALEARAARRAGRLRAAIEIAGAVYASERLHDVRVALKRLRYTLELAADARQPLASRDVAALKTAQDLLGRLHDLELLIARVRDEQVRLSPPTLAGWRDSGSLAHTLEDDCRALHARYMHHRTKLLAIADRIGRASVAGARASAVAAR